MRARCGVSASSIAHGARWAMSWGCRRHTESHGGCRAPPAVSVRPMWRHCPLGRSREQHPRDIQRPGGERRRPPPRHRHDPRSPGRPPDPRQILQPRVGSQRRRTAVPGSRDLLYRPVPRVSVVGHPHRAGRGRGAFSATCEPSTATTYGPQVIADAPEDVNHVLMRHTGTGAEIRNTVHQDMPVTLTEIEAVWIRPAS